MNASCARSRGAFGATAKATIVRTSAIPTGATLALNFLYGIGQRTTGEKTGGKTKASRPKLRADKALLRIKPRG